MYTSVPVLAICNGTALRSQIKCRWSSTIDYMLTISFWSSDAAVSCVIWSTSPPPHLHLVWCEGHVLFGCVLWWGTGSKEPTSSHTPGKRFCWAPPLLTRRRLNRRGPAPTARDMPGSTESGDFCENVLLNLLRPSCYFVIVVDCIV